VKRPSPATAISIVALFFSLGGVSLAASKYLITSTSQIKPSVLTKLRGANGKNGANGAVGTAGAAGTNGTNGTPGTQGASGGAIGATGATGATGTTVTTTQDVSNRELLVGPGGLTLTATCPTDTVLVGGTTWSAGGGYAETGGYGDLDAQGPATAVGPADTPNEWTAEWYEAGDSSFLVYVVAICAS